MTRQLLTTIAIACSLMACGGARPSTATPASPADGAPDPTRAYALLPADANAISYLDIAGIRKTRLYETVRHDIAVWDARLRDMEEGEAGAEGDAPSKFAAFLDLLDASSWLLVVDLPAEGGADAADAAEESPVDLFVVAGDLDSNLVKGLLRSDAEELLDGTVSMPGLGGAASPDDGPATEVNVRMAGDQQLFDTGQRAAAEFDDGLWVFGPTDRVEAFLARANGDTPLETSRTAAIDEEMGLLEHHISLTAIGDAALPLLDGDDGGAFAMAEAGAATIDLHDGVTLRVLADAPTPEVATTMRASLQERIDELLAESWVQLFGVDRILGAVHAEVDESRVSVEVSIAEGDARDLWGRAAGAVGAVFIVLDFFRGFGAAMAGPPAAPSPLDEPPAVN